MTLQKKRREKKHHSIQVYIDWKELLSLIGTFWKCKTSESVLYVECAVVQANSIQVSECNICLSDIDECAAGISSCDVNADCVNTKGSYGCSCKAGYHGDGKNCEGGPNLDICP